MTIEEILKLELTWDIENPHKDIIETLQAIQYWIIKATERTNKDYTKVIDRLCVRFNKYWEKYEIEKNIFVSFSGGESSAFLLLEVIKRYDSKYYDILVCFANVGDEHQETLNFVFNIQQYYNIAITWLEAYVSPVLGKGVMPIVVDYHTASIDGKPMLDQAQKLGQCAISSPHCTRDLKIRTMHKHTRLIFGKNYTTFQGIRADETTRINWKKAKANNWDYPLARWRITKPMIREFWSQHKKQHGFRLELQEHEGNCNLCFKKSDKKLVKLLRKTPCLYIFRKTLELVSKSDKHDPYRGNRTIDDILELAQGSNIDNLSDFGGQCFCS